MKIPFIRRILKEDLTQAAGTIEPWVDQLLYYLNMNMDTIGKALQGNLTFSDNFLCKTITLTFTHNTELSVSVNPELKVLGANPLLAVSSSDATSSTQNVITGFRVSVKGNGSLGLTVNFAGGSGITAKVTWVIFYQ